MQLFVFQHSSDSSFAPKEGSSLSEEEPATDQQQDDSSPNSDVEMPAATVHDYRTRGAAHGRVRGRGQAIVHVAVEPGWHETEFGQDVDHFRNDI